MPLVASVVVGRLVAVMVAVSGRLVVDVAGRGVSDRQCLGLSDDVVTTHLLLLHAPTASAARRSS